MLSKATLDTPLKAMLRVGLGRARLQRRFDDGKRAVGLERWAGRRWVGLKRHLILTAVSYLFLCGGVSAPQQGGHFCRSRRSACLR
jgi:hypothetical protein